MTGIGRAHQALFNETAQAIGAHVAHREAAGQLARSLRTFLDEPLPAPPAPPLPENWLKRLFSTRGQLPLDTAAQLLQRDDLRQHASTAPQGVTHALSRLDDVIHGIELLHGTGDAARAANATFSRVSRAQLDQLSTTERTQLTSVVDDLVASLRPVAPDRPISVGADWLRYGMGPPEFVRDVLSVDGPSAVAHRWRTNATTQLRGERPTQPLDVVSRQEVLGPESLEHLPRPLEQAYLSLRDAYNARKPASLPDDSPLAYGGTVAERDRPTFPFRHLLAEVRALLARPPVTSLQLDGIGALVDASHGADARMTALLEGVAAEGATRRTEAADAVAAIEVAARHVADMTGLRALVGAATPDRTS